MSGSNKLDFVGIGVQRCATTWIYECLREHPEICMPQSKGNGVFKEENLPKAIKKKFSGRCKKEQKQGEFDLSYYLDAEIALKIKDYNPDMKIVISMRDPVERAYSNYLSVKSLQDKNWASFEEALNERPIIKERGFYYKYLKKYYNIFPKENILPVLVEDIKKSPVDFIQNIYTFLEVNDDFEPKSINSRFNDTAFKLSVPGRFIHQKITPWLRRTKLGRKIRFSHLVRKLYYNFAHLYAKKTGTRKPSIKPETEQYLRELYKPDIKKLEQLINKDLTNWKRDE